MIDLIKKHEKYRTESINLIASENRLSKYAREALASDLAGRYGSEWYGGGKYAMEIYEKVEKLAKKVFKSKYALISPLSGNLCVLALIFSFTAPGDEIAVIPKENGGYPFGYQKFRLRVYKIPMKGYEVNAEKIENRKFPLVMLASSTILFPHPIEKISEKINGIIAYDASHVLGLIAGGKFQQPLKEGADVMTGSTHKTLPGPQGGIILTNKEAVYEKLKEYLLFDFEAGIGLVDNVHMNRIASLGIVLEEMIKKGKSYASQTIKNAKELARCLHENGIPVKYAYKGFTQSHQILLDLEEEKVYKFFKKLEENRIFIDRSGRIGVAEATYIGMKEEEMQYITEMMIDVYNGENVRERAIKLAKEFY